MIKKVFKILPLFIIQIIAKKYCEAVWVNEQKYYMAFRDVLIKDKNSVHKT